jgi:CelD/BcsL family acetyltransferase involved in cellulose biosynthesis
VSDALLARTVHPDRLSDAEVACWNDLCRTVPAFTTPFLSFPFTRAAAQVFHGVRVCVVERSGRPVAFFPFQFGSRLNQLLGFGERVGGSLSDYFGIVAAPDVRLSPERLLALSGLNAVFFTHLDDSQEPYGLSGEQPEIGLRVVVGQDGDAYWQARRKHDPHFVAETDRRWRKLGNAAGPVRFVFHEADPLPHLDRLIALKRIQYAQTGVGDVLADTGAQTFLKTLAGTDDPLCRGVMTTLYAGDTYVASHFGLMCEGTFHYWFPAYNADLGSLSPGRLLLRAVVGEARQQGIRRIDLGAGDSQAKRAFANEQQAYLRGLWRRSTPQAFVIQAWQSLRWRLQSRAPTPVTRAAG